MSIFYLMTIYIYYLYIHVKIMIIHKKYRQVNSYYFVMFYLSIFGGLLSLSLLYIHTESIILLMKPISNSWATCGRTFFASSSWSNVFPIGWYPYHIPITSINSYNIPIIIVDNSRYLSYSYNCWYEKPIHVLLMDQWFRVFFKYLPNVLVNW